MELNSCLDDDVPRALVNETLFCWCSCWLVDETSSCELRAAKGWGFIFLGDIATCRYVERIAIGKYLMMDPLVRTVKMK